VLCTAILHDTIELSYCTKPDDKEFSRSPVRRADLDFSIIVKAMALTANGLMRTRRPPGKPPDSRDSRVNNQNMSR
jgi:hypothetical protein